MAKYKFEDIVYNITTKKKPVPEDKDLYVGLEHLDSGCLRVSRYGSDVVINNEKLFMRKGDILFGRRNAYLKRVAIAPHDGLFSAHGMIFRPKDVVLPEFLPFFIASDYFMEEAIKISVGSLSPTVNWGTLKELEFEIPEKDEQKKISDLCWSIEREQEACMDALDAVMELRSSYLDDLYSQKIRIRRDDGTLYPSWNTLQLQDFADKLMRKNKNNETDLPLTISAADGLVDQRSFFNKTIASKDMSNYYVLKHGEFAYNKSYSIGYPVGSVKRLDNYSEGALSSLYICFTLKPGFNSDYIKYYFESTCWYNVVYKIVEEGARAHGLLNVSKKAFFETEHMLSTDPEEQERIVENIKQFDRSIVDLKDKLEAIKKLKQAILDERINENV